MTKRLKLFLTILFGAIAISCCAAGCKVGQPGREEVLAPYQGGHVTYYANGGFFNRNTSMSVRELYFKGEKVPFFDINEETQGIDVMFSGYDFMGWYIPARYESGERQGEIMYTYTYKEGEEEKTVPAYPKLKDDGRTPVTDSVEDRPVFYIDGSEKEIAEKDVRIIPSETSINSEHILSAGEDLKVCAMWKPALKFVYKLSIEGDGEYVYNGKTYKNGDTLYDLPFGKSLIGNPGEAVSVSFDNTTFVANYKDEACTQFIGDYNREDYDGQNEIVVYSKFIEGNWTIVKNNPNKVRDMFNGLGKSTNKYYIIEDVDCSSVKNFNPVKSTDATIEGNGHILSNISIKNESLGNGVDIAPLFGKINATASINNLTVKDINISLKGKGNMTFHAICRDVADGATLNNLTIDGVTATIEIPKDKKVFNAQDGDSSGWLVGGKGTDVEFLETYRGVTLTSNNTLTINNQVITGGIL